MSGQTWEEWRKQIAEEKAKKAVKGKKPMTQQLAEAKAKADEYNTARKASASSSAEPQGEHVINILDG